MTYSHMLHWQYSRNSSACLCEAPMMLQLIRHTAHDGAGPPRERRRRSCAKQLQCVGAMHFTPPLSRYYTGDSSNGRTPAKCPWRYCLCLDRGYTDLHTDGFPQARSYMHQGLLRCFDGIARITGGHSAFLRAMYRLIALFPPSSARTICLAAYPRCREGDRSAPEPPNRPHTRRNVLDRSIGYMGRKLRRQNGQEWPILTPSGAAARRSLRG
jgi:hypothetical protein